MSKLLQVGLDRYRVILLFPMDDYIFHGHHTTVILSFLHPHSRSLECACHGKHNRLLRQSRLPALRQSLAPDMQAKPMTEASLNRR